MNNKSTTPVYIPPINNDIHIPKTPGPRTIESIQFDARERFAGIVWIEKDNSCSLEDYFLEYDNWELYSETKSYSKRIYQAPYKGIMKDYRNYLCILNSEKGEEYYVVSKRVRNELETLEPYCTCFSCSSFILNPLKYIWCPHCTKCIKSGVGFAKPEYIEKARLLKSEKEQRKHTPIPKYRKHFQNISWIKVFEFSIIPLSFLTGLYYYYY